MRTITGSDKCGGVVEVDFNLANSEGVNVKAAATATPTSNSWLAALESDEGGPTYVDNRPMLVPDKPELREYIPTRRDVIGDVEVSQFSDEIAVNCAPLV